MKYKLAIFDLDGTLLDTSEGVLSSVKYTIDHFGFEKLDDDSLKSFIGPPIQDSFEKTYGLMGDILQEIATVFRDRYKNVDLLKAVPYDGIFDSLKCLKDNEMKLAVATYKREDYALLILKHYGFDKYFDIMHGADHNNKLKKSDIIRKCIKESCVADNNKVVLVGDTKSDEAGAKTVGIDFLGVTYGFGFHDDISRNNTNAIGFVDSPFEICDLIIGK